MARSSTEFDPDHLIEAIKSVFGQTLEAGYAGLMLSADVPWLTRNVPGGDRAMEFEEKADEIVNVAGTPLMAICQYRLSDLNPEETLDIMERHPLTLIGDQIHFSNEYGTGKATTRPGEHATNGAARLAPLRATRDNLLYPAHL